MFRKANPPAGSGFTLIEVLVVLAVIAVLLSIAVPSYRQYVQRGQRADAIRTLLEIAACQERVRAGGGYYDTTRCAATGESAAYRFRLEPPRQSGLLEFTIVASPVNGRPGDRCGDLYLDHAGTRAVSGDPRFTAACWGGK